jgi:hypothetical protein
MRAGDKGKREMIEYYINQWKTVEVVNLCGKFTFAFPVTRDFYQII